MDTHKLNDAATDSPAATPRKLKVATVSLAGCFGCHMPFLDIDERILPLLELVEFDRSPLTDIKHCGPCDIGLIEGGVCNAENVHVLREFRANCKVLIALGASFRSCGSISRPPSRALRWSPQHPCPRR